MNGVDLSVNLAQMSKDYENVSQIYDGTGATNHYALLARLREETPVMEGDILARFQVPSQADYANTGRKVFTVFRYKDVMQILRDETKWLASLNSDGFGSATEGFMITAMDGDVHTHFRSMVQPPFLMSAVNKWDRTLVQPLIRNEFIDAIRPRGKMDFMLDFALPFPVRTVYSILGFPDDPDAVMKFASLGLQILAGPQVDPEKAKITGPAAMEAARKLYEHTMPIVQKRRELGNGGDDLIGFMLKVNRNGQTFSDRDIANFVRATLLAAAETTTRTLANMMVQLFEHPDVLYRLRQNPALIQKALNETMRLETVAGHLARLAGENIELGGVTIPKGASVSLCISAANRDPDVYENPDELNIDRPMRPAISFGFGPHICLGMHIARLEIEAAVKALLELPNLRLDPDYPKPVIRGLQFRGPDQVHVVWDP